MISKLSIHDKINLTISNMKVADISTQNSRVFIRIMQYHTKKKAQPVRIIDNSVHWDDVIYIKCILPKKDKNMSQKFLLNFSIRLENPSGRGYVRYGNVDIDVGSLKATKVIHVDLPIHQCVENSNFSADITNENPINDANSTNETTVQSNLSKNGSLTGNLSGTSYSNTTTNTTATEKSWTDQSISETSQSSDLSYHYSSSTFPMEKEVTVTVFNNVELRIREPKMKELENQVDYIVAQIINNSY